MFMDMTGKSIAVSDNRGSYDNYLFEDDKGFFSIFRGISKRINEFWISILIQLTGALLQEGVKPFF